MYPEYADFHFNFPSNLRDGLRNLREGLQAIRFYTKDIDGDTGAISLAKELETNKTCVAFSVFNCDVGSEGAKAFANALYVNRTITYMALSHNRIDVEGIEALANALRTNNTVVAFYLYLNEVTDEGAREIANMLKTNCSLRYINLGSNHISDEGARYFIEALQTNKTLLDLELKQNYINLPIMEQIKQLLLRNKATLQEDETRYKEMAKNLKYGSWNRSKLMVIGQGRAGKSATVRSLLGQPFILDLDSTIGADLKQIKTWAQNDSWEEDLYGDSSTNADVFLAQAALERMNLKGNHPETRWRNEEEARRSIDGDMASQNHIESGLSSGGHTVPRGGDAAGDDSCSASNDGDDEEPDDEADPEVAKNYDMKFFYKAMKYGDQVQMSIWDYGGQEVFYTLHHLFLTSHGVYLLVFKMPELLHNEEEARMYLTFWLNSVSMHARNAPIILVGTYADEITNEHQYKLIDANLMKITSRFRKQIIKPPSETETDIKTYFAVSNKNKDGIPVLRKMIETVTRKQPYINSKVPIKWMKCLDAMIFKCDKDKTSYISLAEARTISYKHGVRSEVAVTEMLELFHELGVIIYLTATSALSEIITIKPQWLINAMAKVIRDKTLHSHDIEKFRQVGLSDDLKMLQEEALASRDLLEYFWDSKETTFFVDLMTRTLLMSRYQFHEEEVYLVPSLLCSNDKQKPVGIKAVFDFSAGFLPNGLFQRLICLAVSHSSRSSAECKPVLFKNFAKIDFGAKGIIYVDVDDPNITLHISNLQHAFEVYTIIKSMLQKIRQDVMGETLTWAVWFEDSNLKDPKKKDCTVPFPEAVKRKLSPWFSEGSSEDFQDENNYVTDGAPGIALESFLNQL